MRYPDQSLIGDLNDNVSAITSGSLSFSLPTSSLDENDTVYDLLPVIINRTPDIVVPIADASTPIIEPFGASDGRGDKLYLHPDGNVKVNLGSNIKLAISASQPPILNVQNGVPTMLVNQTGLVYVWRKDGAILTSTTNDSLQSSVFVNRDVVTFTNIQPQDAGTYVCEISNDIGTTVSDAIVIEVFNLDFDSYFYRNLITNPFGEDGTTGWEANIGDLATKNFVGTSTQQLMIPNRVDLFGYTIDTLNPRPYQIDMGAIRGFNMTERFLNPNASYFTRTRYKFEKKGGTFVVKAYQDIDLTDIIPLTKGGVYGVEGVRAFFSCYIGNGVTEYIPTRSGTLKPGERIDSSNYVMSSPRISVENFLKAGPATFTETAYVTVEEYSNESRLPTTLLQEDGSTKTQSERVVLFDPWSEQIWSYNGQKYYPTDIYNVGETSQGDIRDAILFAADKLQPNKSARFTYGQHAAFKKIIINKLHQDTTKIRITLNFETNDARVFDQWREAQNASDEVFSVVSWEQPYQQDKWIRPNWKPSNPWETQVSTLLTRKPDGTIDSITDNVPSAQDPHVMITGLNLALVPVLKQEPQTTEYLTGITLSQNATPTSSMESGLIGGRIYDPRGTSLQQLVTIFTFRPSVIGTQPDKLELQLGTLPPGTQASSNTPIRPLATNSSDFFPFAPGTSVDFATPRELTPPTVAPFNDYVKLLPDRNVTYPVLTRLSGIIADAYAMSTITLNKRLIPPINNADFTTGKVWDKRVRYVLYFDTSGARNYITTGNIPLPSEGGSISTDSPDNPVQGKSLATLLFRTVSGLIPLPKNIQSYYLDLDFSGAASRVTLSRPLKLWPGYGATTVPIELPHTVSNGLLTCTIPTSFSFQEGRLGGFGFRGIPRTISPLLIGVAPASLISGNGAPVGGVDNNGVSYIVTCAPVQNRFG